MKAADHTPTNGQPQTLPPPPIENLYPADEQTFDVEIPVTLKNGKQGKTTHFLRKPSPQQLYQREEMNSLETETVSDEEEKFDPKESRADSWLYDQIAVKAIGYGRKATDEIELTQDNLGLIPPEHKTKVVRRLYTSTAALDVLDDDEEIGFQLESGGEFRVRQDIGPGDPAPFSIVHTFKEPSESQRRQFRERSSEISAVKGRKNQRIRYRTKLRAYVELYDALITGVEGAQVGGAAVSSENLQTFVRAFDPVLKRVAVGELMKVWSTALQD